MRAVIAIGGNAIDSMALTKVSSLIAAMHRRGDELIITHGNGVQIGELASVEDKHLGILTAQTEAEIGLALMGSLSAYLGAKNLGSSAAVVLTRVLVDEKDPEFKRPTKPIGKFYGRAASLRLERRGYIMKHLIHGYRRVVPSPRPLDIIDIEPMCILLKKGYIVIAAGGGGVPVVPRRKGISYPDAVIDKDFASALLAKRIGAHALFILTNVDGAYLNFGTKRQRLLRRVSAADLRSYVREGHFEEGSMLPKISAAIDFVESTKGIASIGSLSNPSAAIALRSTVISP